MPLGVSEFPRQPPFLMSVEGLPRGVSWSVLRTKLRGALLLAPRHHPIDLHRPPDQTTFPLQVEILGRYTFKGSLEHLCVGINWRDDKLLLNTLKDRGLADFLQRETKLETFFFVRLVEVA